MAVLEIVTYGKDVLTKKAARITEITPEIEKLAASMVQTMHIDMMQPVTGNLVPRARYPADQLRVVARDFAQDEEGNLDAMLVQYLEEVFCRLDQLTDGPVLTVIVAKELAGSTPESSW